MAPRIRAALVLPLALTLGAFALSGCAPTASTGSGTASNTSGADADTSDGGTNAIEADTSSALSCDSATTGGWDLFVDDALTIDPADAAIYPLDTGSDAIHFRYAAAEEYTTYSYTLGYVDEGVVAVADSAIIFPDGHPDAPDDNVFTVSGPATVIGVSGGPWPGILQIEATDSAGIHEVARICVSIPAQ